ncbi:MAG TPA: ScpA family protein [Acidimicrobiales bacterium]|nr:ScpA family protein [Acidimicrobiales bacterium]
MAYEVHLDVFDGPFSLLLQLISAEKVGIYEVRLADIVDGFVAELARAESVDLEVSTEFLLIAATLVELKCRSLLPGQDGLDLEDELALFEARDYLLARLVECRTFAAAAAVLAASEQAAARSVARRAGADERFAAVVPDLLAGVSAESLAAVARRALAPRPVPTIGDAHVLVDEVSVAATIEDLAATLTARGAASFRELTARLPSTAHVVACFLAILELYKQELVELDQRSTFGTLRVLWTGRADAVPQVGTARRGGSGWRGERAP